MEQAAVRLDVLIGQVKRAQPEADPLELVAEAVAVAGELTELADHLIGYFVDHARGQGLSWTQIGARLGVSKQAARKRFAPDDVSVQPTSTRPGPFRRYTRAAQHAIVLAQDNARHYRNDLIGTEHLLLGVCQERSGLAVRAIVSAGLSVAVVRRAVSARMRAPSNAVPERIPFSANAKKALELTMRASLRLGHEHVGTEHLLLGLQALETGTAGRVLSELGLDPAVVEAEVVRLVAGNGPA